MRSAVAALLALALAGCGASAQTGPRAVRVTAEPTPLDRRAPAGQQVGALHYAGGLVLRARGERAFGGLSGLDADAHGGLVAVTDAGSLIHLRPVLDQAGRLTGVADVSLVPLTDENGRVFPTKMIGDAEDLTLLPDDDLAVAYEQAHRITVYPATGQPTRVSVPEAARLRSNRGIEALTYLNGRLIVGAERGDAWSCDVEGQDCRQILVAERDNPGREFALTGLDALPDGRMVAVYRGFSVFGGLRGVVAVVDPNAARPVTVLAWLRPGMTIDNLEGVAAVPREGGYRIYLVSDDNFSPLFRSLLLAFDWPQP